MAKYEKVGVAQWREGGWLRKVMDDLVEDGWLSIGWWLSKGMGGYIGIAVGCFVRC